MDRTGSIFDVQRVADAYVLRFSHEDVGDPDALRAVRHEVGRLIDDREALKVVFDPWREPSCQRSFPVASARSTATRKCGNDSRSAWIIARSDPAM